MKKINFLILIITIALISCERDDICAEGTSTTPQLKVEFYDATEPDDLKSVARLTVYGEGLVSNPTEPSGATLVFNTNSNAVDLPLKVNDEGIVTSSRFVLEKDTNLRLDTENPETSNLDVVEISYIPQFEYVSRACGYKSIFTDLQISVEVDGDNWIEDIQIIESNVTNENTVHVYILH